MPVNKKTLNKGKKVAKKIKKSKHKGLILIVFIIILAVVAFLGYEYIQEKKSYEAFLANIDEINDTLALPNSAEDNLTLPKEKDGYNLVWSSSNDAYLKADGTVIRPTFLEGDKTVELKCSFTYTQKTFIYPFISSNIGANEHIITYKILIKAKEATKEDLVNMVLDGLYVPSETDYSIGLTTKAINEAINITWASSNEAVLGHNGEYKSPTGDEIVTLTATVTYAEVTKSASFDVLVLKDAKKKYLVDEDFNSLDQNSRYISFENGNLTYENAMVVQNPFFNEEEVDVTEVNSGDNCIKLKSNNDKSASISTSSLSSIGKFSFEYQYNASVSESTYLEIYLNDDMVEKINLSKNDNFITYSKDFNLASGKIKILFVNAIKSDKNILIDNFKVEGVLSSSDLDSLISLPSKITKSIVLPKSSSIGGIVTWTSSNESILTSDGILKDGLEENTKVTLSANLTYQGISKDYTFEVDIKINSTSTDALSIYFIDICEEDIGDCGEAILIVYNDMDILVDAGDQKTSTYNCVRNAILEYSSDQILDYVIATHPDSDHIGNMAAVFRDFQVNNLIKFSGEAFTTQKFKNLKAAYDSEPNCQVYDIYDDIINDSNKENDYIRLSDAIYIQFLDTKHYQDSETNGRSIVFLLNVYETKVLFTGDADNLSPHSNLEASYMNEVGDIDILKVVHHGTANGTSKEYLDVIKPEVAIICNGNYLGNKHGHPHVETISRLASSSTVQHIYAIAGGGLHCEMTSSGAYKGTTTLEESKVERNGTITIIIDDSGYTISAKITGDNLIDLRDTTYYKSYLASK